jgi:hypothetical protein
MGRNRRRGPSDPQAIRAANALKRGMAAAAERQARKDPALWGISAEIIQLTTSANLDVATGHRGRILSARRNDPFDALYSRKGLSVGQHSAARRLFRDWCARAGVRDSAEAPKLVERIDGGRRDPSSMVSDAMVDAGRRIAAVLKGDARLPLSGVGPLNAALLEALISPYIDEDRTAVVWWWHVQRVTGENEKHAQAAAVRLACESLRLVYDDYDAILRRRREQKPTSAA